MKKKYLYVLIYLISITGIQSSTVISFDSSGDGYTLNEDKTVATISNTGTYDLSGSLTDKKIIASSSCTINLNSVILSNSGSLTPILIDENQEVELVLSGESTLTDSSSNENDGTIYLQNGASLIISGEGTLNINPNKLMAINGTNNTSLTVNDGITINIESSLSNAGGIYLRNTITFSNAIYTYNCPNGTNHAIDTEGEVRLIKGTFTLTSGEGKGIQTENYLYIGEENGNDSDLELTIITSNEGIEGKKIIIYSGTINIQAEEDGINAASSGDDCDETIQCSGNCACYIDFKGGYLYLTSGEDGLDANGDISITGGKIVVFAASSGSDQPIDQDGLLTISGGTVLAAGSSSMNGVSATTNQTAKTYTGSISAGAEFLATDSSNNEILSLTFPKAATYFYFNYATSFTIIIDNIEITLTDAGQNQGSPGDQTPSSDQGPGGQSPPSDQGPGGQIPSSDQGPGGQTLSSDQGPGGQSPPSDQGPGGQSPPSDQGPGGQSPPSDQGPGGQGDKDTTSSETTSNYDYSSYSATSINTNLSGETITSTTSGESAVYITENGITIEESEIIKSGDISDGNTENSEFYGINAGILVQGGGLTMTGGNIAVNAKGSNGLVSTNGGTVIISGTTIKSTGSASARGLHATYGGTITADNMTISSTGGSCATLATDRGEGTVSCSNCILSTGGAGSPLIYSTGTITVINTTGTASAAQAIVVEGKNSATIKSSELKCTASPNNKNDECGVLIYQSMSGDAETGTSSFTCESSTLEILSTSSYYSSAPIFYITNIAANIDLTNCTFTYGSGEFLVADEGSWGSSGSNGGTVSLTLNNQKIEGDIVVGSSSSLTITMVNSSIIGAINSDKAAYQLDIKLDSDSTITLTGNSYYTSLTNAKSDGSNIVTGSYSLNSYDEESSDSGSGSDNTNPDETDQQKVATTDKTDEQETKATIESYETDQQEETATDKTEQTDGQEASTTGKTEEISEELEQSDVTTTDYNARTTSSFNNTTEINSEISSSYINNAEQNASIMNTSLIVSSTSIKSTSIQTTISSQINTDAKTTNIATSILITPIETNIPSAPKETSEKTSIVLLGYSHFQTSSTYFSFNIYFISVLNEIYSKNLRFPISIIYGSRLRNLDDYEGVCSLQDTDQEAESKVQYSCVVQANTTNIKQIKIEPDFNFGSQSNVSLVGITPLANMFMKNLQDVGDNFDKLSNSTIYVLDHSLYNQINSNEFNISGTMNNPQPTFGKIDLVLMINTNSSGDTSQTEANCTITDISGSNYTLSCKSNQNSQLDLQSAFSFVGDDILLINFDGQLNNTSTNNTYIYNRYNFKSSNGLKAGHIVAIIIVPVFALVALIILIFYFKKGNSVNPNVSESSIAAFKMQVDLNKV